MITKTHWMVLGLVPILALSCPVTWCKAPRAPWGGSQLTISVYNQAGVPEEVLLQGEDEAGQVLRQAGIQVNWLNCRVPAATEEESTACREAVYPQHLHLRIVPKALSLKGEAMGISFQDADGRGCYADLFYEPMQELHKSSGIHLASLLGRVAAHEIGHLLLGTNSHAVAGIMRANWTAAKLGRAGDKMVFLDQESRRMRERLSTPLTFARTIPSAGAARTGD